MFAELKLNFILILLKVIERDFSLVKGLHTILSQVDFPALLDLLKMVLFEIRVVVRETGIVVLAEVLKVFVNQLVAVVVLVRAHVAHVAAPISGLHGVSPLFHLVVRKVLLVVLHDAHLVLVKHVDVVAEEGFRVVTGLGAQSQDLFQELTLESLRQAL